MIIESVPSSGASIVLKLIGRLVFTERHMFQEALKGARAGGAKSITLNFEQTSYIDSAGLGLLMLAHKELSKAGISFNLSHLHGYVLRILDLAKIPELIPIQQ